MFNFPEVCQKGVAHHQPSSGKGGLRSGVADLFSEAKYFVLVFRLSRWLLMVLLWVSAPYGNVQTFRKDLLPPSLGATQSGSRGC